MGPVALQDDAFSIPVDVIADAELLRLVIDADLAEQCEPGTDLLP